MDHRDNELLNQTQQDGLLQETRACPSCGATVPISLSNCPVDGTVMIAAPELGSTITDKYEIIGEIGRGGIGVVFKARQKFLNKMFAIKMLHTSKLSPEQIARFHKEARALSKLQHPNLVSVVDFGLTQQNQPFMVMDFIEGQPLSQLIKKEGSLPPTLAVDIAVQVARAISYAHSQFVLHRDLKPENIIVGERRSGGTFSVHVLDFGMAKLTADDKVDYQLTKTGEIFGSPLYMSPEQAQGKSVDARSDIYSLGCVLFESISGSPPYVGDSSLDIMVQKLQDVPPVLSKTASGKRVPFSLAGIVATALERDVGKRFNSMQAFEQALSRWRRSGIGMLRRDVSMRMLLCACIALVVVGSGAIIVLLLKTTPSPVHSIKSESTLLENSFDLREFQNSGLDPTSIKIDNESNNDIVLSDMPITDENLKQLRKNYRLTKLRIQGWRVQPNIDDRRLDYIVSLPLNELVLIGCPRLTDEGVKKLAKMQTLDKLVLEDCAIDDNAIAALRPLSAGLKTLGLNNCHITDKGGVALTETFPGLTNLSLRGTRVSGVTVRALPKIKNLDELDIGYIFLANEQELAVLKNLPHLRSLHISGLRLKSDLADYLVGLPSLALLQVDRNGDLGDRGLINLARLQHLKELQAFDCGIHQPGFEQFKMLKHEVGITFVSPSKDYRKDLQDRLHDLPVQ